MFFNTPNPAFRRAYQLGTATRPEGPLLRSAGVVVLAGLVLAGCQAFTSDFGEFGGERVRSERDRAAQRDTMLALRLEGVLPTVMEEAEVDCWLVVGDGPVIDPVVRYLVVSTTRTEGRSVLLLCNGASGPRRLALGHGMDDNRALYEVVEPDDDEHLAVLLREHLDALAPRRIAVNLAPGLPPADGLSASNDAWLRRDIATDFADRLVSAGPLVELFLSRQLDVEAPLFVESLRMTQGILAEVLSDQVVVAAGTSVLDLDWAVRERVAALGGEIAFSPRVIVYRPGDELDHGPSWQGDLLLQPGDLVFLSAGIRYLGYVNRLGRWAYLLHTGESTAPEWVDVALGELADAAEAVAAGLQPGASLADVESAASRIASGLDAGAVSVARLGRWQEGPANPLAEAPSVFPWDPRFRLAANDGLAITVRSAKSRPEYGARPLTLASIDTVLVAANGARFVVPPQRVALLID